LSKLYETESKAQKKIFGKRGLPMWIIRITQRRVL